MIICIVADPSTGQVNMFNEGCDIPQARMVLQGMIEELDRRFNNGVPAPRMSGLIVPPGTMTPPPAPPSAPSPPPPPVPGLGI